MLFDTTNATSTGIPDGEHNATIVGCELKDTKDGTGKYLNIKWQVDAGSAFFYKYNVINKSEKTMNISKSQIADIQLANGKPKGPVHATEELLGLRCKLKLKNETDDYGDKIRILKHAKAEETTGEIPF
jgi:hypothetical protein